MTLAERVVELTLLVIIWIPAFFGNISLWIIILRTRGLREQSYHMLLILSCADILVSVVSMPVTVVTLAADNWLFSTTSCVVIGFLTMLTFIASVMSLGAISMNRYVKICQARHYHRIYTSRNVVLIAFGVWTLSLLLALPPLIGWGKYDFLPNQSFCFCDWTSSESYTIFMIAVCFGGPCSVMTFCYVNILKVFRRSTERLFGSSKSIFKTSNCFSKVSQDPSTVSHAKIEIKILSVNPVDRDQKMTKQEMPAENVLESSADRGVNSQTDIQKREIPSQNVLESSADCGLKSQTDIQKREIPSQNVLESSADRGRNSQTDIQKREIPSQNVLESSANCGLNSQTDIQKRESPSQTASSGPRTSAERQKNDIPPRNLLTVERNFSQRKVQFSNKKSGESESSSSQSDKRASRRRHEEYMLAVSLLLVIFVFIVCWLPFCVAMFVTVFSTARVPRAFDTFALLLGYANSCCNPVIYGFMNKRFKREYWRMFRCVFSHCCRRLELEEESADQTGVNSHSRCASGQPTEK